MLYLVGLGLSSPKDITVRGLEIVQQCSRVYLEAYTLILMASSHEELEALYQRPVTVADRELVEQGADTILANADTEDVAFLVVGDPFGATTHTDLVLRAREMGIAYEVVHNALVMNAVGACGLQLYTFGQTVLLVFFTDSWRPELFYPKVLENRRLGLHTLVLLDIKVKEQSIENMARGRLVYEAPRYMQIDTACQQMLEIGEKNEWLAYTASTPCVGILRLGLPAQAFKAGSMAELAEYDAGAPLHSLIVLGRQVHELELEFLKAFALDAGTWSESCALDQEMFKPAPWVPPAEEDEE